MDQLDQWFYEAAGFSGSSLSMSIRVMIILLSLFWGAFIFKGFYAELNQSDDAHTWFIKTILLCVLLLLIWVMTY